MVRSDHGNPSSSPYEVQLCLLMTMLLLIRPFISPFLVLLSCFFVVVVSLTTKRRWDDKDLFIYI